MNIILILLTLVAVAYAIGVMFFPEQTINRIQIMNKHVYKETKKRRTGIIGFFNNMQIYSSLIVDIISVFTLLFLVIHHINIFTIITIGHIFIILQPFIVDRVKYIKKNLKK